MSINSLVIEYQQTQNELTFNEVYQEVSKGWKSAFPTVAKRYKLDVPDVWSIAHEKLLDTINKFDASFGKSFESLLRTAISNGCKDELRRNWERLNKEIFIEGYTSEDEGGSEVNIILNNSEYSVDNIEEKQKSPDQRQLIGALVENADYETRQSLEAFAKCDSFRKAAKLVGTTDKTVKKRLRKLALNHDANRFGEIYEYFTVATERVS